jgi:hypothetical protein
MVSVFCVFCVGLSGGLTLDSVHFILWLLGYCCVSMLTSLFCVSVGFLRLRCWLGGSWVVVVVVEVSRGSSLKPGGS